MSGMLPMEAVCDLTGLTVRQVLEHALAGKIRYRLAGAEPLFNRADVQSLLDGHARKPRRHRDGWDGQRRVQAICSTCGRPRWMSERRQSARAQPHCYFCGGPMNLAFYRIVVKKEVKQSGPPESNPSAEPPLVSIGNCQAEVKWGEETRDL